MDILLNIKVSVDDPREAEVLMDAAFTGLAAQVLKMGILYGQMPAGPAMVQQANVRKEREVEQGIQLQRQVTSPGEVKKVAPVEMQKPKGLAAVRKMRRE